MSALAPALQAYFTGRLNSQPAASPNTIAADKHASRLLLAFAARRTDATPSLAIGIPMLLRPPGPRPRRGGHLQHPSTGQS
jgi:hypothetical protein